MIGSMFNLQHRVTELRPTERDHEVARQLRDAASVSRGPTRTPEAVARRDGIRIAGQPTRVAAR